MSPSGYGACFGSRISMVRVHSSRLYWYLRWYQFFYCFSSDFPHVTSAVQNCYNLSMKKALSFLLIYIVLSLTLKASIFSGYDFTFFSSVVESIAISDSERIGFDYTGYGYLGDMTTGIFLRLGVQAPYSTLLYTLDDIMGSMNSDTSSDLEQGVFDENQIESRIREYKFLIALGPSFRRFVSPTLSWYMGLGLRAEIDRTAYINDSSSRNITFRYLVSTDVDFGFRLTADIHTTFRIGVYFTRPLFILDQSYVSRDGGNSESEFVFTQNIYPDLNSSDTTLNAVGYISLGHTYTSYLDPVPYRYVITSRNFGEGRLEMMNIRTED